MLEWLRAVRIERNVSAPAIQQMQLHRPAQGSSSHSARGESWPTASGRFEAARTRLFPCGVPCPCSLVVRRPAQRSGALLTGTSADDSAKSIHSVAKVKPGKELQAAVGVGDDGSAGGVLHVPLYPGTCSRSAAGCVALIRTAQSRRQRAARIYVGRERTLHYSTGRRGRGRRWARRLLCSGFRSTGGRAYQRPGQHGPALSSWFGSRMRAANRGFRDVELSPRLGRSWETTRPITVVRLWCRPPRLCISDSLVTMPSPPSCPVQGLLSAACWPSLPSSWPSPYRQHPLAAQPSWRSPILCPAHPSPTMNQISIRPAILTISHPQSPTEPHTATYRLPAAVCLSLQPRPRTTLRRPG